MIENKGRMPTIMVPKMYTYGQIHNMGQPLCMDAGRAMLQFTICNYYEL
jgi:hypothetical protein